MRLLGIDDTPSCGRRRGSVQLIGCLYRCGMGVEGILSTRVRIDGLNATDRILAMLAGSRFEPQVHAILLDGIAFGGFNVVDLPRLAAGSNKIVMSVMRKRPDLIAMERALAHVESRPVRLGRLRRGGTIHPAGPLWFQIHGGTPEQGRRILDRGTRVGNLPEPLRLAHLIAGGITRGESRGRA